MQKLVVTMDQANNANLTNPSQVSFTIQDSASKEEAAARICAMFYHLGQLNVMSNHKVREITVSSGSGPGQVVPVAQQSVIAYVAAANALISEDAPVPSSNGTSWYGRGSGGNINLLPLGTSLLVTETPLAYAKGRIFLPFASPDVLTSQGTVSPDAATKCQHIMEAYYGLVAGQGPLEGSIFAVNSRLGIANISNIRVSEKFARLKSRTR